MTHPHLEGLIPRLRDAAKSASRSGLPGLAVTISVIADDLAALPGGGVDGAMVERLAGHLGKRGGPLQSCNFAACRDKAREYLTAALSPTPTPHEADQ